MIVKFKDMSQSSKRFWKPRSNPTQTLIKVLDHPPTSLEQIIPTTKRVDSFLWLDSK